MRKILAVPVACVLLAVPVISGAPGALAAPSSRTVSSAPAPRMSTAQLQRELNALGYWVGKPTGTYNHLTRQGVMALQKAAGLKRDGVFGPATRKALRNKIRPKASFTGTGVLIDKKSQLLMYFRGSQLKYVINTSTGTGRYYREGGRSGRSVTPSGTFRIQRGIKGWRRAPLGSLYSPKYFKGGYAIHGSLSIPGYPASHGCARVSTGAMDMLWPLLPTGTKVIIR